MLSVSCFAAESLDLNGLRENTPLGLHLKTLRTTRDDTGLTDHIRQAYFQGGSHDALNFGYTKDRIWLKFTLSNTSDHDIERMLNIRYPLLDKITLYSDSQPEPLYSLGRLLEGKNDQALDVPASYFVMPITVKSNSFETYYLSVESDDSLALPIYLTTQSALETQAFQYAVNFAFYIGLVITNILFAFFMTLILRDREQLYYCLFMISNHFAFFSVLEGMPNTLLGIDTLFINRDIIPFVVCFSMLLFTLFAASYLRLYSLAPKAYRLSRVLVGLMIFTLLLCFILPYFYAITLSTFASILVGMFYGSVAKTYVVRGRPGIKSFILAWGLGVAGAMIYGLKVWGIIPVNFFTSYSWHIGTLLEAAVFSAMMAYRAAQDRKERLVALQSLNKKERDLRHTQEQLLATESAAKTELELQVKQRTRDLSNLLGQLEDENKSLAELSINDALTKVRNRRFFNDIYPQMWNDSIEERTPISVIMLDIDHFKRVNDDYGHLCGDHCLVTLAQIMQSSVNHSTDVVCRYGGEEFAIILTRTTAEQACVVAERIRENIEMTIITDGEHTFKVTSSFGVAGLIPTEHASPDALIAQSDAALYKSKRNGRNRVTMPDDEKNKPIPTCLP
jgi:diguanylate cyclase (GGDEF)-like protein|tara:strand:+ start:5320 stop:7179 length:1860 start_codon:yes stop_codon:yes gene_type:complete